MIGRFAKGIVLGTVIGAVGGVLFAPKAGRETRDDLERSFGEIKDKVAEELMKGGRFTKKLYNSAVEGAMSKYEVAGKIAPRDAKKIKQIFDRSYGEIAKIVKKDAKKIMNE